MTIYRSDRQIRDAMRDEVQARWPTLFQFLAGYCHEDWPEMHGTPEGAVDAAIADYSLELRRTVLKEWRDWRDHTKDKDVRQSINDALGVCVLLDTVEDAWSFMNMVQDKLIASVRAEYEARL